MGLEFFGSSSPPGGGGVGTVTSITTASNSLKNNSAPNPIVAAGTIDFEVQIIDGTYVAIALLELGGALLEGVIYRITDFNKVIGNGVTLVTAEFMTVKNSAGATVLSTRGTAHSGTQKKYELSYELQVDIITELYLSELNQRASRSAAGGVAGSNCIETLPWEDGSSLNFNAVESNLFNVPGIAVASISNSELYESQIDYGSNPCSITSTRIKSSTVSFLKPAAGFNGVDVKAYNTLMMNDFMTSGVIEEGTGANVITVANGSPVSNFRIGVGESVTLDNTIAQSSNFILERRKNNLQLFVPTAGGNDFILDSYSQNIFVNLTPAAPVVTYVLQLPPNPLDRQVINIGCTQAMATVTIAGSGHTVQDSVAVFSKGQCISYIFDSGSNTYYLV